MDIKIKIENTALEAKRNIIIERAQKEMKMNLRGKNNTLCK